MNNRLNGCSMLQGDTEQMVSSGQSSEGGPKNPATAALEAAKAVNAGEPVAAPKAPQA